MGRVQELPDDDTWITDHRRTIGARIRAERERQKLTQEQVILAGRIDRVTIWRVETGEDVKLSTLMKIARVLDVPLADLVR
ncbi:transcriptional regulator with XRE-family HTH domain [Streptomyces sp. V3I8]|uniref:helix-turn-helix domain-containing protein n=1 Tax=Streptomyces sp. V3I8 TaxID=3042279 RepID=UPI00278BA8CA|nr:helix-turn-helix transcriptional regulator [Streptomyces sp. V3I8]MDQ1037290.1 transcriptional regulator with XRE-family HTH domain [Streptomyces sp. V3I8]